MTHKYKKVMLAFTKQKEYIAMLRVNFDMQYA